VAEQHEHRAGAIVEHGFEMGGFEGYGGAGISSTRLSESADYRRSGVQSLGSDSPNRHVSSSSNTTPTAHPGLLLVWAVGRSRRGVRAAYRSGLLVIFAIPHEVRKRDATAQAE